MDSSSAPGARSLTGSGFPGDTGEADAHVRGALAAYAAADPADSRGYVAALAALAGSRVLVPVVAMLGEVDHDEAGLAREKDSDMAAVLLRGADGRLALLAFTGVDSLHAWDPAARPVPVTARTAARSALQDEAAALVVDVAGPARLVVEGEDLRALAEGWTLARVGDRPAWIRPPAE